MQPGASASSLDQRRVTARAAWKELSQAQRRRLTAWAVCVGVLALLFARPLVGLVSLANQNSLHSHVVLVPFITAYLLIIQRRTLPSTYNTSISGCALMACGGLAAVVAANVWAAALSFNDYVAVMTAAFVSFIAAGGFLFLGARWMSAAAFPLAFLVFMIPLPDAVALWLERVSVLASAEVASWFLNLSGTLMIREGTIFELPGITLRVTEECSGIRSSWVLFITSILASHVMLEDRWRRLVLVGFVLPLAIVRNAFRIFVIAQLCIQIGPYMINSIIHRRGGPFFFALSLIPLFLVLIWLWRGERRRSPAASAVS
jgi:exosortase C (VPDSG-CTERM-specific)